MKTEYVITLIVCIISAIAIISEPIIFDIYKSSVSKPDIQTYLEFNKNSFGNTLDFKVKNIGEQTAILRSVEIEVLNYSVDTNPNLKRGLSNTEVKNNKISYLLNNFGGGPAQNVSVTGTNVYEVDFYLPSFTESSNLPNNRFYEESIITKKLGIKFNKTLWVGDVPTGNSVEIQHSLANNISIYSMNDSIFDFLFNNTFTSYSFFDRIEYYDLNGEKRTKYIAYEIAEVNGSFYGPNLGGEAEGLLNVSQNYDGLLSTKNECPFVIKIPISHELKPNEPDRFSLTLDSDKTAEFDIKVYLIYDEEKEYIQGGKLTFSKNNGNSNQSDIFGFLSLLDHDFWC